jgi:hypothetical protein
MDLTFARPIAMFGRPIPIRAGTGAWQDAFLVPELATCVATPLVEWSGRARGRRGHPDMTGADSAQHRSEGLVTSSRHAATWNGSGAFQSVPAWKGRPRRRSNSPRASRGAHNASG